ncbi:MAG: hypothetical protein QOJ75_732 [Chloroflexota bacterium]|nr:hypothetical protein [Chloroflexota bacterium]
MIQGVLDPEHERVRKDPDDNGDNDYAADNPEPSVSRRGLSCQPAEVRMPVAIDGGAP